MEKSSKGKNLILSIKRSWQGMLNNKVIFLPEILSFLFAIFVGTILLWFNGMFSVIPGIIRSSDAGRYLLDYLKGRINEPGFFLKFLLSMLLAFVVITIASVIFKCIKLEMMRQIVRRNKAFLRLAIANWKKYFWRYIGVELLSGLIYFVITIAILIIIFILGFLFKGFGQAVTIITILIFLVLIIVGIIAFIYFALNLLFVTPILFLENTKAIATVRKSFSFFNINKKRVVFALIITVLIGIVTSTLKGIFNLVYFLNGFIGIIFLVGILKLITDFIRMTWTELFLFFVYEKK